MDERLPSGESTAATVCYRHPDRPTRLSCTECGRPICVDCSNDAPVGQKCPECSKPTGRHRVVDARRAIQGPSFETSPVSFSIIAIAAVVFVLGFVSGDLDRELFDRFALVKVLVKDGEWWRALSAAFLHGSLMHILFNMYALYLFGPRLEREVGSIPFATFYLAAAAGGSVASTAFGPEFVTTSRGVFLAASVGASGAIFGLFGAWIWVAYKLRTTPAGRAMFNQLGVLLALNAFLPVIIRNIDWRAHLGGFVVGVAIAALWGVFAAGRRNARIIRTAVAGALLVALMGWIVLL
jgi:membrane associated rhomboid family serine protease